MSPVKQKMYPDHSKGWNTAQNPFNQDPKTVALAKNAMMNNEGSGFEKREGVSDVLNSDFSPDEPVQNIVTYESLSGVETVLFQVKEEWYKLDGDGTRTVVHSGSDTKQHGFTVFNGRLIFGSRDQEPKKFLYLQPPLEATTGQTSSGSQNSRTYYVSVTYITPNGETNPSPVVRQDVDANKVLTVSSPASQDGSTGYKVYVGTDKDDLHFQEQLSVGSDYQEPNGGIDTSSDAPPSENTAWNVVDVGGDPPKADLYHTHNSRVFAAVTNDNRMKVLYSGLEDEDDWPKNSSTGGSAEPGFIEFEKILDYGDEVIGMESFQKRLVVFFKNSMVSVAFPTNATNFQVEQVMRGKGAISKKTIQNVGNDVFFLSRSGIESVGQNFGVENLTFDDDNPSFPIDQTLQNDVVQMFNDDTVKWADAEYYWPENLVVWSIPQAGSENDVTEQRLYVFDLDTNSWTSFSDINPRCMTVDRDGNWYYGKSANVAELFDGTYDDFGNDIEFKLASVWQFLGNPNLVKVGKFVELPALAGSPTNIDIRYAWDYAIDGYEDPVADIDSPGVDTWGESLWTEAPFNSPQRGKPRIPIRGRGKSIKMVFVEKSQDRFEIPWWKFEFKVGGLRTARG